MLCLPKPRTEFPASRPKSNLEEEDDFMQLHGGKAARVIYLIEEAIAAILAFVGKRLACLPLMPGRPRS